MTVKHGYAGEMKGSHVVCDTRVGTGDYSKLELHQRVQRATLKIPLDTTRTSFGKEI